MITSLLLTVALCGQWRSTEPPLPIPDYAKNLAFTHIMEKWVRDSREKSIYKWTDVLDDDDADLIRMLDCEHFHCRRHAQKYLREMGHRAIKATIWGTFAKRGEVKQVCEQNLLWLYQCTDCKGVGQVAKLSDEGFVQYMRECGLCNGTGSFYWTRKYNFTTGNHDWSERDIFAKPQEKKE